MTVLFTTEEILYATGGKLFSGNESVQAGALVWDIEKIKDGDWFVAIASGAVDTHDMLDEALGAGAAGCIVNRRPWYQLSYPDAALITVSDTKTALFDLLRYFRHRRRIKTVGVSGTDGRRATMLVLQSILMSRYRVHTAQMQSLNWLSCSEDLLKTPLDSEILLFECSAVDRGDISRLASALEPDLAVLTQIKHPLPNQERSSRLAAVYCELLSNLNKKESGIKAVVYDRDPYVHSRSREILAQVPARYFTESSTMSTLELPTSLLDELNSAVQSLIGVPLTSAELWCAVEAAAALGLESGEISAALSSLCRASVLAR